MLVLILSSRMWNRRFIQGDNSVITRIKIALVDYFNNESQHGNSAQQMFVRNTSDKIRTSLERLDCAAQRG
jgi:hypothetical protein